MSKNKEINSFSSLKFKLVANFMLMLIPVVILGWISQTITTSTMENQAIMSTTNTINQMVINIENINQTVFEVYKQVRTDQEFLEQLRVDTTDFSPYDKFVNDKNLINLLSKYISSSLNVSDVTVILEDGRMAARGGNLIQLEESDLKDLKDSNWMEKTTRLNGKLYIGGRHLELDNLKVKYKLDEISYGLYASAYVVDFYSGRSCYIIVDISKDIVRNLFDSVLLGDGSEVHIINYDGRDIKYDASTGIINSSKMKEFYDQSLLEKLKNYGGDQGYLFTSYKGQQYLVVLDRVNLADMMIVGLIPKTELTSAANRIGNIMLIVILVTSIVIILMGVFIFPRNIYDKVNLLIKKMKAVSAGDMELKEEILGSDEFAMIDRYFNKMVQRLNKLIRINYIKEIEKKQAELSALQFQINPHFLYNTLASINSMAAVRGYDEITNMTEKLGDMFRYNMNPLGQDQVLLKEEINHIRNYIEIENIRFGNKIAVFFDIDEELQQNLVSRFILQPIVENCVKHGMGDLEGEGVIEIIAYEKKQKLYINICDDGDGIPKDIVTRINKSFEIQEGINESYQSSIGLRNVDTRIKMAFGSEYGIKIYSQLGVGTEVLIMLPSVKNVKEG